MAFSPHALYRFWRSHCGSHSRCLKSIVKQPAKLSGSFIIEVNILWAAHQVHHSAEDYNLTTALRQSVIQKYTSAVSIQCKLILSSQCKLILTLSNHKKTTEICNPFIMIVSTLKLQLTYFHTNWPKPNFQELTISLSLLLSV